MKIVFLTKYYSPNVGGVEKHVCKLTQELKNRGHSVTVVTSQILPQIQPTQNSKQTILRIPYQYLDNKIATWKWIIEHKQLFSQANIIHIHDVFWWYLPLRFIFPYKPIYTTFHGWEGIYPPARKAIVWRKLAEKLSRGNICVGYFISHWYKTKPNLVTYGATDQKALPLNPKNNLRILVLGRLSPDNDIEVVVTALKQLKMVIPNIKVAFVGDGPLGIKASQVGKVLGFKSDVTFYLKNHNWVITSSYLSIADSLAANRYVFSTFSNPLKKDYLTGHPCSEFFSINSSSDELFASIKSAVQKPTSTEKKLRLAHQWTTKQTWKKLTDQYLKLWGIK